MTQQLVMPDDELARKAGAIKVMSLGMLVAAGVGGVMVTITWLFERDFPIIPSIVSITLAMLISSATYWMVRAGRVKAAGYFFVICMVIEVALTSTLLGGSTGPMVIIYLVPILISGVTIGINAGFRIATLVTVVYLTMVGLERAGILPYLIAPPMEESLIPYIGIMIGVVFFYFSAFLGWVTARWLNQALQDARRRAADLQVANEKLQASEEELRTSNEQLDAQNEELRSTEEELRSSNEELEAASEELREAQEQLVRSEKLAAIGQLAGGVGHELRNPLGAIKNAVYYIRGKLGKSELAQQEPRVMEFLGIVDDEISSSDKIINDLLSFSRVGKPAVSPARIGEVIDDAISHTHIPENIALTKKVDAGLPQVEVDTDQIRQVFINMITNAVQAMPEGGKLAIEATGRDSFLEVKIADTGSGIPEEAIGKIFDPLYTMKAKGIGLGLAVCKSIIDRHEGHIEVESKVGKGTTFIIKLPLQAG